MGMKWILVVDDSRTVVLGHRDALKRIGMQLKTASTLDEARQTVKDGMRFDIVVLDYALRDGECGLDLADEFREMGATIVLCTGYESPSLRPEVRALVDEVMGKPLDVGRIAEIMRRK